MSPRSRYISYTLALMVSVSAGYAEASEIFQVSVGGVTYSCGSSGSTWRSGQIKAGKFTSYRQLAAKARQAAGSAQGSRRTALLSKAARHKSNARLGDPVCDDGPPGGGGTPTPTPAPGNFDLSGNLTEKGKTTFGVPAHLSGNTTTGRALWNGYCAGCHTSEQGNRSFSNLRTAIAGEPMYYTTTEITDVQLANLVAFLNRFRLQ